MYEKMQRIYILQETYQLLQQKQQELQNNGESSAAIEDDLRKIEEELQEYTNSDLILTNSINKDLIFPYGVYDE